VLLAGAALVHVRPAVADTFPDLYSVSVAPNPDATDARTDAIRRAMAVLLTRITGRAGAGDDPRLADLIRGATRYLNAYDPSRDAIRVGFSRSAVEAALLQLNMPIWGDERPATLLWLAVDLGGGQRAELQAVGTAGSRGRETVAGVASNPLTPDAAAAFRAIVDEISSAADERGLPLVLPRLDAEDRRQVRFADVWGGFDPFVARAAVRYAADAVLIGRVGMTDTGPEVGWTFLCGDTRQLRTTSSVRAGIDAIADLYAAKYTVVGGAQLTRMTIQGIRSWPDFGRVLGYLDTVSVIDSVDVESLSTDGEMLLRVAARGDDNQLRQYLTLDGELVPSGEAATGCLASASDSGSMVFVPKSLAGDRELSGQ
jgi:uncharacterized protein